MARRQLEALFGHQVEEAIGHRGQVLMHRIDHILVLVRPGNGQHRGVGLADQLLLDAQAAGNDDATVFVKGFADGFERFLLGTVEKAAGIDQHDIGAGIVAAEGVALRAQGGHDAFAVDEGLGAAEADEADFRRLAHESVNFQWEGLGASYREFDGYAM